MRRRGRTPARWRCPQKERGEPDRQRAPRLAGPTSHSAKPMNKMSVSSWASRNPAAGRGLWSDNQTRPPSGRAKSSKVTRCHQRTGEASWSSNVISETARVNGSGHQSRQITFGLSIASTASESARKSKASRSKSRKPALAQKRKNAAAQGDDPPGGSGMARFALDDRAREAALAPVCSHARNRCQPP